MTSKLISNVSKPACRSELAFFDVPMTQIGIEKAQWNEIPLKNSLTDSGPYEFQISPNPQLLQLSKNYLLLEVGIVDADGMPITEKVIDENGTERDSKFTAPINLLGKTFFRQVRVLLNGSEVFDSGSNYAYRAYLETELCNNWDNKSTTQRISGYSIENTPIDSKNNVGFLDRARKYRNGETVQLFAPIHCDLFAQDKLLLPNVDVRLILYRNSDNFCLLNYENPATTYHLKIHSMKFYVKSVDVLKSVSLGLERTLQKYTAKYPIKRVQVQTVHVSAGRRSSPENDLFAGNLPRRVIIGCVAAKAYHGTIDRSPFSFQNFDLSEIFVTAGGIRYPSTALSPKYDNDHFARAYMQLMDGIGLAGEAGGKLITPEKFKNGWCLYCFDLTPTADDNGGWNLARVGSTSIHMDFAKEVPDGGIEVIVYAEFDSLISIDNYRNCFTDYKP